ncbi:MAG TPA: ABC transporter ATP-binding protein [Spirochaetia bacterium]|nr:ABC transporter ATP-binding protein [Spirochaetia bacterium]
MLRITSLAARYGAAEVLHAVSLHVGPGEIVTIIGANGAGKSTLLNAVAGVVKPASGTVLLDSSRMEGADPAQVVSRGCVLVPEGRQIFPDLSVRDNLLLGGYLRWRREGKRAAAAEMDGVCELFPVLEERREQRAGTLSGGEQQMLALGRALMARPRLLMLDEPSIGLAPLVVREIFDVIRRLRERGTTVLLVEQNARAALAVADRGYVMETGRIMLEGAAAELAANHDVRRAYLGKEYRQIDE